MSILRTPAACTYLNGGVQPDASTRRPIGPQRLLKLAKAGEVPVFEWLGSGPTFSTAELDRWLAERGAA